MPSSVPPAALGPAAPPHAAPPGHHAVACGPWPAGGTLFGTRRSTSHSCAHLPLLLGQLIRQGADARGVEGNRHLARGPVVSDLLHQQADQPGLLQRRQRRPHRVEGRQRPSYFLLVDPLPADLLDLLAYARQPPSCPDSPCMSACQRARSRSSTRRSASSTNI